MEVVKILEKLQRTIKEKAFQIAHQSVINLFQNFANFQTEVVGYINLLLQDSTYILASLVEENKCHIFCYLIENARIDRN